MLDLKPIRERCERATPGRWDYGSPEGQGNYGAGVYRVWLDGKGEDKKDHICDTGLANSEFISCSRQDIPALLDEIESLRCVVDACRGLPGLGAYCVGCVCGCCGPVKTALHAYDVRNKTKEAKE